jgi:hypothetical protein
MPKFISNQCNENALPVPENRTQIARKAIDDQKGKGKRRKKIVTRQVKRHIDNRLAKRYVVKRKRLDFSSGLVLKSVDVEWCW